MRRLFALCWLLAAALCSPRAEEDNARLLNAGELDVLLGPIALYPDPLLAILLPAAMEPADIVLAVRYLDSGADPALAERQRWDENVKGLVFYPEVLRWLDENLEWTRAVGEAFLLQPEDVMAAIQRLRRYAHDLGNLVSTTQQIVEADTEWIDILPADADIVYAPVYPRHIVYTERPAAGASYISFRPGARVGPWLRNDWDWRGRRVVGWSRDNFRPRTWWCQSRAQRFSEQTHIREWCPRARGGQFASKWWTQRNALCQAAARGGGGLKAVGSSGGITPGAGAAAGVK